MKAGGWCVRRVFRVRAVSCVAMCLKSLADFLSSKFKPEKREPEKHEPEEHDPEEHEPEE